MRLGIWLTLLILALGSLSSCDSKRAVKASPKDLNILLVVIDTLGAKHLGSYNPALTHSPRIDALALKGLRFSNAFATSSWTKPTIASIFTSRMPYMHGVIGPKMKLSDKFNTIAELMSKAGFDTVGIVSHIFVAADQGFAQGFAGYHQVNDPKHVHNTITSELVSNQAINWLKARQATRSSRPFFMFLHYFDPHFCYQHHPDHSLTNGYAGQLKPNMSMKALFGRRSKFSPDDWTYLTGLYHEEIAYTDAQIGRVLDYFQTAGLEDKTLVVLTADHGEEFGEHRSLAHTRTLYDELIHIPLIFSLPGQIRQGVSQVPVSQLDLLPTMLSLAGIDHWEQEWQGINLTPYLLADAQVAPARDLYAEVSYVSLKNRIDPHKISVRSGKYKAIFNIKTHRWQLFDLERDPGELNNIAKQQTVVLEKMKAKLSALELAHAGLKTLKPQAGGEIEVSPEEIRNLKSLGYM